MAETRELLTEHAKNVAVLYNHYYLVLGEEETAEAKIKIATEKTATQIDALIKAAEGVYLECHHLVAPLYADKPCLNCAEIKAAEKARGKAVLELLAKDRCRACAKGYKPISPKDSYPWWSHNNGGVIIHCHSSSLRQACAEQYGAAPKEGG